MNEKVTFFLKPYLNNNDIKKAGLYFNDQSQVNKCTLVNKHIYNLQHAHCGRHQETNICLLRMSPFMTDIKNEQKQLIRDRHLP